MIYLRIYSINNVYFTIYLILFRENIVHRELYTLFSLFFLSKPSVSLPSENKIRCIPHKTSWGGARCTAIVAIRQMRDKAGGGLQFRFVLECTVITRA